MQKGNSPQTCKRKNYCHLKIFPYSTSHLTFLYTFPEAIYHLNLQAVYSYLQHAQISHSRAPGVLLFFFFIHLCIFFFLLEFIQLHFEQISNFHYILCQKFHSSFMWMICFVCLEYVAHWFLWRTPTFRAVRYNKQFFITLLPHTL